MYTTFLDYVNVSVRRLNIHNFRPIKNDTFSKFHVTITEFSTLAHRIFHA